MIIPQAELELILNPRIRRRLLHLPVRHGKHGERKKCPARKGGIYQLRAAVPYERHRTQAAGQPTRARAVLRLIDLCDQPTRTATITVIDVDRDDDMWLVRFVKGERSDLLDRPIYLAKYGDYTMTARSQAVPGDPEVVLPFAEDLAKARAKALERRVTPERTAIRAAARDAETLQQSMKNMKVRMLVKRAQRNYEAAERILLSEGELNSDEGVVATRVGRSGEEGRPPPANTLATPEAA